ncbi:MAG: hypothetical protein ACYC21_11425 [Eubacteriales bacterium]
MAGVFLRVSNNSAGKRPLPLRGSRAGGRQSHPPEHTCHFPKVETASYVTI